MRPNLKLRRLPLQFGLIALLMILASTSLATEAGTFAKALEQAQAQNKILVVDFYTDW